MIDRRTGIPITLSLLYMEIARRAGLPVEGINFPGTSCAAGRGRAAARGGPIIDPFHGGALLAELLARRSGHDRLPRGQAQILTRMLVNLKRVYGSSRSRRRASSPTC